MTKYNCRIEIKGGIEAKNEDEARKMFSDAMRDDIGWYYIDKDIEVEEANE